VIVLHVIVLHIHVLDDQISVNSQFVIRNS